LTKPQLTKRMPLQPPSTRCFHPTLLHPEALEHLGRQSSNPESRTRGGTGALAGRPLFEPRDPRRQGGSSAGPRRREGLVPRRVAQIADPSHRPAHKGWKQRFIAWGFLYILSFRQVRIQLVELRTDGGGRHRIRSDGRFGRRWRRNIGKAKENYTALLAGLRADFVIPIVLLIVLIALMMTSSSSSSPSCHWMWSQR